MFEYWGRLHVNGAYSLVLRDPVVPTLYAAGAFRLGEDAALRRNLSSLEDAMNHADNEARANGHTCEQCEPWQRASEMTWDR